MSKPAITETTPVNSEALLDLLSQPIAFHRAFVKIGGGVTAGLLLSQAFYWSKNKTAFARDGWFYKSHGEWEEETGLTRREQQTARAHLREKGLLEERDGSTKEGRVLWYRVNRAVLFEELKKLTKLTDTLVAVAGDESESDAPAPSEVKADRVAPSAQMGCTESPDGLNESAQRVVPNRPTSLITSETTSETTAQTIHTTQNPLRAARADAPAVVVCGKSRFSEEDCRRYADHLHASGQGVINPGGFAKARYRDGTEDAQIAAWLATVEPERVKSGELPAPVQIDASACPDCEGKGFYYPDPQNPTKGVAKCRHPKLVKAAEQQDGQPIPVYARRRGTYNERAEAALFGGARRIGRIERIEAAYAELDLDRLVDESFV